MTISELEKILKFGGVSGPDPDFGLLGGGGTTQHEGTGHQLIKSEKMQ